MAIPRVLLLALPLTASALAVITAPAKARHDPANRMPASLGTTRVIKVAIVKARTDERPAQPPPMSVTQWCQSYAERRAPDLQPLSGHVHIGHTVRAQPRFNSPIMALTPEVNVIRQHMHPLRERRRALRERLATFEAELQQWRAAWRAGKADCVGDECLVQEAQLESRAMSVRSELESHRAELEKLDRIRVRAQRRAQFRA
jgi:hypothetical protein